MGFRALRRYQSQKAKFEAYKAWEDLSPEAKAAKFDAVYVQADRSKPERVKGYISPFNTTGTTQLWIKMKVLANTQTGQGGTVATALKNALDPFFTDTSEPAPAGPQLTSPGFKAAKLKFTERTGFVKKNSRITGAAYQKPQSDSVTAPFGQSVPNQDFDAAVALIQVPVNAWMDGATATLKRSFKFTPEGI